jgi:hypothetical protein
MALKLLDGASDPALLKAGEVTRQRAGVRRRPERPAAAESAGRVRGRSAAGDFGQGEDAEAGKMRFELNAHGGLATDARRDATALAAGRRSVPLGDIAVKGRLTATALQVGEFAASLLAGELRAAAASAGRTAGG